MEECFVCSTSLKGFDVDAATHHLNACMEAGPSEASNFTSSALGSDTVDRLDDGSDAVSATCPVCGVAVDGTQDLQDHVEACLIGQDQGCSASTGSGAPPDNTDNDACPSCFQEWTNLKVPFVLRDEHVTACLAEQSAFFEAEDGPDEGCWSDDAREKGRDYPYGFESSVVSPRQARALLSKTSLSNGFGKLRSQLKGKGRQQDPYTPNIIPQLVLLLNRAFSSGSTRSAVLCSPNVWHARSQMGDFGWGCGYKNLQMLFSAVRHVEQYRCLFVQSGRSREATPSDSSASPVNKRKVHQTDDEGTLQNDEGQCGVCEIPSIREIQEMANEAWKAGFDPEGCKHFRGNLLGSKKWIGTSEAYVVMSWLGVRATIIDFPKATGPKKTHTALTKWVFDYFNADMPGEGAKDAFDAMMASRGSNIRVAHDKLPLYLQHDGHSRTIVGVEVTKKGDLNLLLFDPTHRMSINLRDAALTYNSDKKAKKAKHGMLNEDGEGKAKGTGEAVKLDVSGFSKLLEPFRVNLQELSRESEYQILRVETEGGPLDVEEKLQRRVLTSVRVT